MKKILLALSLCVSLFANAAETTKVCVDVKDKAGQVVKDKAGKPKQNCKTMKVHKKLEGTEVPVKK
jgi:hypothetical protein